jgi:lipopolysaccharide biosynthesis glycosyltransferase
MKSQGIYYIATGEEYLHEAEISAKSVLEQMPNVNIAIATDGDPQSEYFDYILDIPDPQFTFADQIENLNRSPFDHTIYLDTDIYITGDISDVFDLLNEFDIAMAQNPARKSWDVDGVPPAFPEYNSGVVGYRTEIIGDFEAAWKTEYDRQFDQTGYYQNQPALRKVLFESNLRIATLPAEYNCITWMPGQVSGQVKVFHCRLRDIGGDSPNSENISEAIREINATKGPRVFTQLGGISVHSNGMDSPINRLRMSLRRHGLKRTLLKIYEKI